MRHTKPHGVVVSEGDRKLNQESAAIDRVLLTSAAKLARAETTDDLLQELCQAMVAASPHVVLAQIHLCQMDDARDITVLCTADRNAVELSVSLNNGGRFALQNLVRRVVINDLPLAFDVTLEPVLGELRSTLNKAHVTAGLIVPFAAPSADEKAALVMLVDSHDYIAKTGVEPFLAFTSIGSALLQQAAKRQILSDYATFDHLTGLLNRRALAEILEREHVRAERHNRRYSVLFFDLDHFKSINGRHGHAVGDMALQNVARIAHKVLREGDWVGRWGGEEFLCILPDASEKEAEQIAQRLRAQVAAQPLTVNEQSVPLTLSIGVACFPNDGLDINTLLVHADAGLADAKQSGRNTVRRYAPRLA